ncbi:MAG: EAL domain-containing protein [Lachnospiraceae bacterium]|nr:EAL domain-containing protein [Lachnospiraceae bacterium]
MLKYYPQYCQAAIFATIILLIIYFMKQNYSTKQGKVFVLLMVDCLISSALNILTFYTISFPERYPMWLNYLSNQVYLLLFNLMAVLFLYYVDVMTKRPRMLIPVRVAMVGILLADSVLLFSSPYTHLTIYFDENLVYSHGPLMITLYLTAFLAISMAAGICAVSWKQFNAYQVFAVVGFVGGVFVSLIFQVMHPAYVISNLTCALMLFFLYSSFENPAYYTYNYTRCFNRRAFLLTIHKYKKKGSPYEIVAVKMADFDNLVSSFGQDNAYLISSKVADRLNLAFKKRAYCISMNCFAIICDSVDQSGDYVERVRDCFTDAFQVEKETEVLKVAVDAVIKLIPIDAQDIDGLEMEEILHTVMDSTSDDVFVAEDIEQLVKDVHRKRQIGRIVGDAIKNNRFEVYYQPIYNTKEQKFTSSEALIRLKDQEFGFISPEEFIPIAERSGQIDAIGEIVFRKVCEFMKSSDCLALGVRYIEVNLSPVQCRKMEISETFYDMMKEYEIRPEWINLEITETAEMEPASVLRLTDIMNQMHNKGITFSIDDFGSGFAAIDYLVKLPVELVKIDKGILWQAMEDPIAMIVLKNTIEMIKTIDRKIVVEGVETEEMADILISSGCDYLQGYLYSKPVPAEQYLEFLKQHHM